MYYVEIFMYYAMLGYLKFFIWDNKNASPFAAFSMSAENVFIVLVKKRASSKKERKGKERKGIKR